MNYIGRISVTSIIISWLTIESILDNEFLFIQFALAIPLGWFLGKQYDLSQHYAKELKIAKQQLKTELSKNLTESEDRYQHLIELSPDLIAVHEQGEFQYINPSGVALLGGQTKEQILGRSILDFVPRPLLNEAIEILNYVSAHKVKQGKELQIIRLDGEILEIEASAMPVMYQGRPARQIIARDISYRKQTERMIEQMAYYDSLTGLPNRYKIMEYIEQRLIESEYHKTHLVIMFIDLDGFKLVNDTYGHQTGDLLLTKAARRLTESIPKNDMAARHGGDEFIICLSDTDRATIENIAQGIIEKLSISYLIGENEVQITPSIGISLSPRDGRDKETLIKHADMAMYRSKEKGKNMYQFFSEDRSEECATVGGSYEDSRN